MPNRPKSFVLALAALLVIPPASALGQTGLGGIGGRPSTGYSCEAHFDAFATELRRYKNGESWVKFLALPQQRRNGENTKEASAQAEKLLKRFDKLSRDPKYTKVTALPGFWLAHESLKLKVDPSPTPSEVAAENKQPVVAAKQDSAAAADPLLSTTMPSTTLPSAATHQSVGERILKSVVALEDQLAKVAPHQGWAKRLSLDELEVTVSMISDQVTNDSDRKSLQNILLTYQSIAKNKDDAVISQLPEFKETLQALNEYLKPNDVSSPKN